MRGQMPVVLTTRAVRLVVKRDGSSVTSLDGDDRSVTISDVAAYAGVSRAAVSKVLRDAYGTSDSMRTRVNAAIDALGYRPSRAARSLRGAGRTIGIDLPTIGDPSHPSIVNGILSILRPAGYHLMIVPVHGPDELAVTTPVSVADFQVDGIIGLSPIDRLQLEKVARRVPTVVLGRHEHAIAYDTVVGDDVEGTRLAMNHLFELGHEHIAHVTGPETSTAATGDNAHSVRLFEYERLMRERGTAGVTPIVHIQADADENESLAGAIRLLQSFPALTAIFAANDSLAMPVLHARADLSRTALAVVGYDESPLSRQRGIDLTSIDQGHFEMGRMCARLLLERIAGRTASAHRVVGPALRVRASSMRSSRSL